MSMVGRTEFEPGVPGGSQGEYIDLVGERKCMTVRYRRAESKHIKA